MEKPIFQIALIFHDGTNDQKDEATHIAKNRQKKYHYTLSIGPKTNYKI